MAIEVAGFKPGVLKAGADLSGSQFLAGKLDANGDVVLGTAGALCAGMIQNKPALGVGVEMDMDGISKAVAGAAFTAGTKLMSTAAGKLITATATNHVVAVALDTAGALNEIVAVKVVGLSGDLL